MKLCNQASNKNLIKYLVPLLQVEILQVCPPTSVLTSEQVNQIARCSFLISFCRSLLDAGAANFKEITEHRLEYPTSQRKLIVEKNFIPRIYIFQLLLRYN